MKEKKTYGKLKVVYKATEKDERFWAIVERLKTVHFPRWQKKYGENKPDQKP